MTSERSVARRFFQEVPAGTIEIKIIMTAPMICLPSADWKESLLGVLHGSYRHPVGFHALTGVMVERWMVEWPRKFQMTADIMNRF